MVVRRSQVTPTTHQVTFGRTENIVSKTDLKGVITYANDVFTRVCGYSEAELIGKPHNIIRHPDFPGSVFLYLWQALAQEKEVFAYVKNLAKDGSYYWVLAHVTPCYDQHGTARGHHSNRRWVSPGEVEEIDAVYDLLRAEEAKYEHGPQAAKAGLELLVGLLTAMGVSYDEFVWDLIHRKGLRNAA